MTASVRGRGRSDLLAAVPIVLGFQPHESVVLVGMADSHVEFCARSDIAHVPLLTAQLVQQTEGALPLGGEVAVVAWSAQPTSAAACALELAGALTVPVSEVLVTDGSHYWSARDQIPGLDEGIPFTPELSPLTLQAVVDGVVVAPSREDEVREVSAPPTVSQAHFDDAQDIVRGVPLHEQLERLAELVEAPAPLTGNESVELAALLGSDDALGAVLARVSTGTAATYRRRLLEARLHCPPSAAANVVALLALTCWLDNRSAQMNACLDQLTTIAADHPVLGMLLRLNQLAIPPRRWDEV